MTETQRLFLVEKASQSLLSETCFFDPDEQMDKEKIRLFKEYPHLFVLCCLMDKQIDATRAWNIPFIICQASSSWRIQDLKSLSEDWLADFFNRNSLHRFNNEMARVFHAGVERIRTEYKEDASLIWEGKPNSASVVARFLEFDGCGIKIATMATNLLHRGMGVEFSDYSSIDISPDVHIIRILSRLGLLKPEQVSNKTLAIYKAREINPSYPGLIDGFFWRIGTTFCRPSNPNCSGCPIESICPTSHKAHL